MVKWTYGPSGDGSIVPGFYRNHHAKYEINKTIITCLNKRKNNCYGRRTDPNYTIASFLKGNLFYL